MVYADGRKIDKVCVTAEGFPSICRDLIFLENGKMMQGKLTFAKLVSDVQDSLVFAGGPRPDISGYDGQERGSLDEGRGLE